MSNDNPPMDHVAGDSEPRQESDIERNIKSKSTWLRLVYMLVFGLLAWVATMVAAVVVVLGFFWVLFTGERNAGLTSAGQSIATYLYEILRYLTYNSDQRPFPFDAAWPAAGESSDKE